MKTDVREVIQSITDKWFLTEPLLFGAYCAHQLHENKYMLCAFRSGNRKIEFNPNLLSGFEEIEIAELLRREVLRIILKHPYERQPVSPIPEILYLASNLTIYENGGTAVVPQINGDLNIPSKLSFEEYYNFLLHNMSVSTNNFSAPSENENEDSEENQSGSGADKNDVDGENKEEESSDGEKEDTESNSEGSNGQDIDKERKEGSKDSFKAPTSFSDLHEKGKDATELWAEDEMQIEYINRMIENAMITKQWGSLPGHFQEIIKASTIKADNIRRKLDMFRTSIISTDRRLTRMRPSRRYGWTQMGVVHPYVSKLLIAVDTSGSVLTEDLSRFFSVVNSFFTYGIPNIDVIQFDVKIHFPLLSLKKASKEIKVLGRGGTDFQAVIDYYKEHKEYDGLIIFTDGDANIPKIPPNRKILWVLRDIQCYNYFELNPKVYI